MKNLSDFKKRIKVGVELSTEHEIIGSLGIRKVSIAQSNSFALATPKGDEIVNSWCYYPKASLFKVVDENTVQILESYKSVDEVILTYTFVNPNQQSNETK